MVFFRRKKPEEVFTPRSSEVNSDMYVNRPEHEQALRRGIRTGYNIVIFGDSGCGKSWLYKKVFRDDDVYYSVLDFKDCRNEDEVDLQILDLLADFEEWEEAEKQESKALDVKPKRIGFGKEHAITYKKIDNTPYIRLVSSIRKAAKRRKAFLVFENLEYILDKPEVIDRIRSMLLALDNDRVGIYGVKICLVGVPADIKEVLSDGNRHQTISNRVYEIPEVGKLKRKSVDLLVTRGLEQELDFMIESKSFCLSKIAFVTYQTPQYIHDVCLHIALRAEDSFNSINPDTVDNATVDWIVSKSGQSIEFIRSLIMYDKSARQTKAKIIYSISRIDKHFFSSEDINEVLRREFPNTMSTGRIQTLANLRKISNGDNKLLKCDPERLLFRVATPYLRSCLRICLKKGISDERVSVKQMHLS